MNDISREKTFLKLKISLNCKLDTAEENLNI